MLDCHAGRENRSLEMTVVRLFAMTGCGVVRNVMLNEASYSKKER
jgi:hypothetical protein